ncbi:MAG: hypothetical protein ACT4PW_01700 [Acidimicrobiia bacterium]
MGGGSQQDEGADVAQRGRADEHIRLTLPADSRYLDVALAALETLADRAGVDKDGVAAMGAAVRDLMAERVQRPASAAGVVVVYEVGKGFLGVRFEDGRRTDSGASATA